MQGVSLYEAQRRQYAQLTGFMALRTPKYKLNKCEQALASGKACPGFNAGVGYSLSLMRSLR